MKDPEHVNSLILAKHRCCQASQHSLGHKNVSFIGIQTCFWKKIRVFEVRADIFFLASATQKPRICPTLSGKRGNGLQKIKNIWRIVILNRLEYRKNAHQRQSQKLALVVGLFKLRSTCECCLSSTNILSLEMLAERTLQTVVTDTQASPELRFASGCRCYHPSGRPQVIYRHLPAKSNV